MPKCIIEIELPEGQLPPDPRDVARLTSDDWLCDWWHIDDIKDNASEELTDDEAREVLELAERYRDCNIGLNWDSFGVWTDWVLDKRPYVEEEDEDEDEKYDLKEMDDELLLSTYRMYKSCQTMGVSDMVRLAQLEKEMDERKLNHD